MARGGDEPLIVLHGYHLDGSGSCVYVRNVVREFARRGVPVVLLCQEPEIERYGFVSSAYAAGPGGELEPLFERKTRCLGSVAAVRPHLEGGLLPVFVDGRFPGFDRVKPFTALSDGELAAYVASNTGALLAAIDRFGGSTIFANHIVMMPYIALEAARVRDGIGYYLIPHGSEIEYLVKKDRRYGDLASEALAGARGIVSGSREMVDRIESTFPGLKGIRKRCRIVPVGVDVDLFAAPLEKSVAERTADLEREVRRQIAGSKGAVDTVEESFLPSLERIDFSRHEILVSFGKLIPGKGVQDLIAVAPLLFRDLPLLRIIIAGDGEWRAFLAGLIAMLQEGDRKGFLAAIRKEGGTKKRSGAGGDGDGDDPFRFVRAFLDRPGADDYFAESASFPWADRIVFAGFLRHEALRNALCLSRVALFPSIVKEAYPLALTEAMATGVFPVVSDTGGLKEGLDALAGVFPQKVLDLMRIPMDPESRLSKMRENIIGAFAVHDGKSRARMVRAVEKELSWKTVGARLLEVLR